MIQILVDTGVLLRALHRSSPLHGTIIQAMKKQRASGNLLVTSHQNISEFWNVATRPASARGGFGLTPDETHKRVQTIEKLGSVLPFTPRCYAIWRIILISHQIIGLAAHDARLIATMQSHGISHLLTLNGRDFQRYSGITVCAPNDLT